MATINVDFPIPVLNGKTSYWRGIDVAKWMREYSTINVEDSLVEILGAVDCLNQAIEKLLRPESEMTSTFSNLLKSVA